MRSLCVLHAQVQIWGQVRLFISKTQLFLKSVVQSALQSQVYKFTTEPHRHKVNSSSCAWSVGGTWGTQRERRECWRKHANSSWQLTTAPPCRTRCRPKHKIPVLPASCMLLVTFWKVKSKAKCWKEWKGCVQVTLRAENGEETFQKRKKKKIIPQADDVISTLILFSAD